MISIHNSVRGILFVSIVIAIIGIIVVFKSSKDKKEYNLTTGSVEFLEKEYLNWPNRHHGEYRYLKVNSYPYVFEIYAPNSEKTEKSIDELKPGNLVDVYYYEIQNTHDEKLNRFVQFIDHKQEPYFIRNGFQKQLGFVVIVLAILLNLMSFIFWKMGKLGW